MEFVEVFNCICYSVSLAFILCFLENKLFLKNWSIYFVITLASDLLTFGEMNRYSMPIIAAVLILFFILFQKRKVTVAVLNTTTATVIVYIPILILGNVINLIFIGFQSTIWFNILMGISLIISTFLSKKIIVWLGKKLNDYNLIWLTVSFNIFFIAIFNFVLPMMMNKTFYTTYAAFSFGFIILFTLWTIMSFYYYKNNYEKAITQKELKMTLNYQNEITKMFEETVAFKHFYIGLYKSMYKEIENKNLDEVKNIFEKYIIVTSDKYLYLNNDEIKKLDRIKNKLFRNFIYGTYLQCKNLSINFVLNTGFNQINSLNISDLELIKILNIFTDNAIAECEENGGEITIALKTDKEHTEIIIKNTFKGNFTFKGEGHGNGLKTAGKMIDSLDNVTLHTIVDKGYFIQKLIIEESTYD